MTKIFFRIDDRLIHGQVIEGWVHNLNLTRIVIVSDNVKADKDYKRMLEISVPRDISVDILSIKEMAAKMSEGYLDKEDTIVLFENTSDVLELLDNGAEIESVNVGCLHYDGNNYQLRPSVALSDKDLDNLKDINAMGTIIESFSLPQDKSVNLIKLFGDKK